MSQRIDLVSTAADVFEMRRQPIISAARVVFSERGFCDAKVSDIANRAGVSSRTMYQLFNDKTAIFEAAVLHATREACAGLRPEAANAASARAVLQDLAQRYASILEDPSLVGLLWAYLAERPRISDRVNAEIRHAALGLESSFVSVIQLCLGVDVREASEGAARLLGEIAHAAFAAHFNPSTLRGPLHDVARGAVSHLLHYKRAA